MAKIARKNQKIFGKNSGVNEIGVFGSFAAGSATYTTDPEDVQSLSNCLDGWFQAILGDNSPSIEDMNALCFLFGYQLSYIMQAGIPEWDDDTEYCVGSMVNLDGLVYISITNGNTNNPVTDVTNWKSQGGTFSTKIANYTATMADEIIRGDTTSGAFTVTLPAVAASKYKKLIVKNVGSGGFNLTLKGNAAENIDGANTLILTDLDSATVFCNGTSWDVI